MAPLKFACHADAWKPLEWEEALDDVSKAGFTGVEGIDELYRDYAEKVELAKRPLTQRDLHLIALSNRAEIVNPDLRAEILRDALRLAEFLQRMGADYLILETGSRDIVESLRRDFHVAAETLNELGKRCSEYDIHFCVQPRCGDRIQTAEEIDRILNEVDTREVFLCLDSGQLHLAEQDPVFIVKTYGACVKHLYFSDVPFPAHPGSDPEEKPERQICPPGQGAVDFPGLRDVLQSLAYAGWIAARFDAADEDPAEEIRTVRKYLETLFHPGSET
jgi:sugar phosphate isomerase/epimerase